MPNDSRPVDGRDGLRSIARSLQHRFVLNSWRLLLVGICAFSNIKKRQLCRIAWPARPHVVDGHLCRRYDRPEYRDSCMCGRNVDFFCAQSLQK